MCTETKDARVHCTILNDHTNRGRTPPHRRSRPRPSQKETTTPGKPGDVVLSGPNSVLSPPREKVRCFHFFSSNPIPHPDPQRVGEGTGALHHRQAWPRTLAATITPNPRCSVKLLRKEVIQPHLPVRLPCYDFVPIASPTFDRSPHKWLGHGLRVLPTFVT